MATNLGRKIFRQIPRYFAAAGTGGNMRSTTNLAADRSKAHPPKRLPSSMTIHELNDALPDVRYWIPVVAGVWWLEKTMEDSANASAKDAASKAMKEYREERKQTLERMGLSREVCEAKIAERKRKMESESASEDDSGLLKIYEGWLRVYIEAE